MSEGPEPELVQKLNKLSVKHNVKVMLENECNESINEFITLANQTIKGLKAKIAVLEAASKEVKA